jgi:hypothetical protein
MDQVSSDGFMINTLDVLLNLSEVKFYLLFLFFYVTILERNYLYEIFRLNKIIYLMFFNYFIFILLLFTFYAKYFLDF